MLWWILGLLVIGAVIGIGCYDCPCEACHCDTVCERTPSRPIRILIDGVSMSPDPATDPAFTPEQAIWQGVERDVVVQCNGVGIAHCANQRVLSSSNNWCTALNGEYILDCDPNPLSCCWTLTIQHPTCVQPQVNDDCSRLIPDDCGSGGNQFRVGVNMAGFCDDDLFFTACIESATHNDGSGEKCVRWSFDLASECGGIMIYKSAMRRPTCSPYPDCDPKLDPTCGDGDPADCLAFGEFTLWSITDDGLYADTDCDRLACAGDFPDGDLPSGCSWGWGQCGAPDVILEPCLVPWTIKLLAGEADDEELAPLAAQPARQDGVRRFIPSFFQRG